MFERAYRFPNLLSEFVYTRTYARWLEDEKRRETWPETVGRYVDWVFDGKNVPSYLPEKARAAILNFDVLPSMRALWCAGDAMARDNVCGYNCAFAPIDNLKVFGEALMTLMSGTGFGYSVERTFIDNLPQVAQPTGEFVDYVIGDSTEGWADAVYFGVTAFHRGQDVKFHYDRIRPKGSRLKIKGGRASGPEPLKRVLDFARETISKAAGRRLKPIEAHDIMCMIAEIVMVGGFRRASLISFSDPDDTEMRHAKDWSKGEFPSIRYMANISAYYSEKPTQEVFWREWEALVQSGSGERGFSMGNWHQRADRPAGEVRSNPCHEIGLRFKRALDPWTGEGGGGQFCNLAATVMRSHDTLETMAEKVKIATWIGAVQSSYTHFPYLRPAWTDLCLTGDTKISLLNGKEERIQDLVGKGGFWVYSYDSKTKKMAPGWAHSVRVTQRDAELVRVTLDSGESFDCTPNHPVLLRSGEYREAGSLVAGDSLRPLYRRLSTTEDEGKGGRIGYEMCSVGEGWEFTHALTAESSRNGCCQVCGKYERTPEHLMAMSERSKKTCHEMWHVKRGQVSEACSYCGPYNHKVASVERLNHREDVYDLTVDEHHNFALSCGVFVHNCNEDRLLGIDITGQCDNPALSGDEDAMTFLNATARATAIIAADALGINRPAAVTCGKPSGNTSQLVDCASGFHSRYAKFYHRHVRISAKDPLFRLIRDTGVPVFKENGQEHLPDHEVDVWVARFPVKAPETAMTRHDEKTLDQLERYLQVMRSWCGEKGHNQSATIYVREGEWTEVGEWLWEHFDEVTGLSFLPFNGGNYKLAPYEELTEEEYLRSVAEMPELNFKALSRYEQMDEGNGAQEPACASGQCEL